MMNKRMHAIRIYDPMDYRYEEVSKPVCPDGGLLVKVSACGLCGSDLRTIRSGHRKVTFPWIIGHEITGIVEENRTADRKDWPAGTPLSVPPVVYCGTCEFCRKETPELCLHYKEIAQTWPGGFAEYIVLPPEVIRNSAIQPLPKGSDLVKSTLAEPLSSCINAMEKGNVGKGDTVVIIGAGPVGTLHLVLSRIRGAKAVYIADVSEDRLKSIEALHPDAVINAARKEIVREVKALTRGRGADVIITANPVPETQVQAVEMAGKGGRILLFGGLPKNHSKPGIDTNLIHYNALHIIGTTIFAPRHHRDALDLLASDKIPAEKIITHILPLSRFGEGVTMALQGKARKVVFKP